MCMQYYLTILGGGCIKGFWRTKCESQTDVAHLHYTEVGLYIAINIIQRWATSGPQASEGAYDKT